MGLIKRLAYDTHQRVNPAKAAPRFRVALTAFGEGELRKKVAHMRKMIADRPFEEFSFPSAGLFYGVGPVDAKTAYIFPGQGSQYLGMGKTLAETFLTARRTWESLGNMRLGGKSVKEMVFIPEALDKENAKETFVRLSSAEWAGPSTIVAGEAILQLLEEIGSEPDAVASHSFGDVAALRAAGVFTSEDILKISRIRGELTIACHQVGRGCILIVNEGVETINDLLARNGIANIWIANYNTKGQATLTGTRESVERANQIFRGQRIASRLIPISGAPHCPLAYNVTDNLSIYLRQVPIKKAKCDFYSFLFGRKVVNEPDVLLKILKTHSEKPVRFVQQIERMYQDGFRTFIEIGPSDVLTTMVGQILEGRPHTALNTDHRKEDQAVLALLNTVAELFKQNRVRDLSPLWEGYRISDQDGKEDLGKGITAAVVAKYLKKLELEFAKIERVRVAALVV
ncbi:MAG: ACP S-malonyltransferase [Desulfobacterales bacterium]|nr:ACP S-malonyltransferase [Desulfobacterales bacterium]